MNEIETHINKLLADVPESGRKKAIIQEITQNLNEKVTDLISDGQTRDEAVKSVIDNFGDIDDLKKELVSSAKLAKSKKTSLSLAFSVWGAILTTAFFMFINLYYSPQSIWFVYPAFAVIWWPMSLFFHWYRNRYEKPVGFAFSVCGSSLLILLLLFINFYYTPHNIWFVYPTFAIIWWPMSMLFYTLRKNSGKDDETDE